MPVAIYDALIDCDLSHLARDENGYFHIGASWDTIAQKVLDEKPAIVGITNPFLDFIGHAMTTARIVRRMLPNTTVIIGGPHASSSPESFFCGDTGIDFVFRGDGELSLIAFVKALSAGKDPNDIAGLAHYLTTQPRSAWSFEVEARPNMESW